MDRPFPARSDLKKRTAPLHSRAPCRPPPTPPRSHPTMDCKHFRPTCGQTRCQGVRKSPETASARAGSFLSKSQDSPHPRPAISPTPPWPPPEQPGPPHTAQSCLCTAAPFPPEDPPPARRDRAILSKPPTTCQIACPNRQCDCPSPPHAQPTAQCAPPHRRESSIECARHAWPWPHWGQKNQ